MSHKDLGNIDIGNRKVHVLAGDLRDIDLGTSRAIFGPGSVVGRPNKF
jgi:hypothetical protein